jgi:hypothetical protein
VQALPAKKYYPPLSCIIVFYLSRRSLAEADRPLSAVSRPLRLPSRLRVKQSGIRRGNFCRPPIPVRAPVAPNCGLTWFDLVRLGLTDASAPGAEASAKAAHCPRPATKTIPQNLRLSNSGYCDQPQTCRAGREHGGWHRFHRGKGFRQPGDGKVMKLRLKFRLR